MAKYITKRKFTWHWRPGKMSVDNYVFKLVFNGEHVEIASGSVAEIVEIASGGGKLLYFHRLNISIFINQWDFESLFAVHSPNYGKVWRSL